MQITQTTITPEEAASILRANKNNRPISGSAVKAYVKDMLRGAWRFNGDAIRIDEDDNLLDGQHRLLACVRSGVPLEVVMMEGLSREVFTTIDTGKKRNASDILSMEDYKHTTSLAAGVRFLIDWDNGARSINSFAGGYGITNDDVLGYVRSHPEIAEQATLCKTKYTKICGLVGASAAVGCLHLLCKKDEELAHEFFHKLASGSGLNQDDVIFQLRERLISLSLSGHKLRAGGKAQLIISAWNKLRSGRVTGKVLFKPEKPVPEVK